MSKDLEVGDARARAGQIRTGIHDYLRTLAVIAEAFRLDDWRTLGYADWTAYVDGEFGETRLRLPREHRLKAIEELRLAGMSGRAIAATTGLDRETVAKGVRQVAGNQPPDAALPPVKGTDGKSYTAGKPAPPRQPLAPSAEAFPNFEESDEGEAEVPSAPEPAAPSHDAEAFKSALDEHVPDPDKPLREWRLHFLRALKQGGTPLQFTADDVAEKADDECLDELVRLADSFQDFVKRVQAKRPKPTRNLRVVS